jgi:exosortase A-associated hydrolase 1
MKMQEQPVVFDCSGEQLVGIVSLPEHASAIGVVIVVGGPQYRVGSHRQFVYLARALAQSGIACLRFDYRGMGDSDGAARSFETVDADIGAAMRELMRHAQSVKEIVLWGLCDGASAALMALQSIGGVASVVALNPWVRSETSLDQTLVKHYYLERLRSGDFWRKLLTGKVGVVSATGEFFRRAASAFAGSRADKTSGKVDGQSKPYQVRMCDGLKKLESRPVLVVLSGRDLTAQEYVAFAAADPAWRQTLARNPRVATKHLPEADHTFSDERSRIAVERLTCDFVLALPDSSATTRPARQR